MTLGGGFKKNRSVFRGKGLLRNSATVEEVNLLYTD